MNGNNLDIYYHNCKVSGDIIHALKIPVQNREGFRKDSYAISVPRIFYRFIGIEKDEKSYREELWRVHKELSKYDSNYLKIDSDLDRQIPITVLNRLNEAWKNIYEDGVAYAEEIVVEMAKQGVFPRFNNPSLQFQIKNYFKILLEMYSGGPKIKIEEYEVKRLINNVLHWLNMYGAPLLENYKYDYINPKVLYYGDITIEEEIFLIILSMVGCDIVYYNSENKDAFKITDRLNTFSTEILYNNFIPLKEFPTESEMRTSTIGYEAKEEMRKVLYSDTNIFRPWELQDHMLENTNLRMAYEELSVWIKEPALIRDGWQVTANRVYTSNVFVKVSGVHEDREQYWEEINFIKSLDKVNFFNKLPIAPHMKLEFVKFGEVYPNKLYSEFDEEKLLSAPWWRYKDLRTGLQKNIAYKIKEMCINPPIKNIDNEDIRDFQTTLFSILINIDDRFMKMLQRYDYHQEIPKILIYNNEKNGNLSFEDCVTLVFMKQMGVDIIIYNPSGYNDIEKYVLDNQYQVFLLDDMEFGLDFEDLSNKKEEPKKGLLRRLFGR